MDFYVVLWKEFLAEGAISAKDELGGDYVKSIILIIKIIMVVKTIVKIH